jgi:hypothetical protein
MAQDTALWLRRCFAEQSGDVGLESRTRCQYKKPSSSSRFEGGNRPQRWGGAGTRDRMEFRSLVNSAARVPACPAGSRGFNSRTRRQSKVAEIAQQVERRVEGACVGGSEPSLGTKFRTWLAQMDPRAPVYDTGGRTFESCTRCQQRRASSKGRAAASKAEGSRFDPVVRCRQFSSPIAQMAERLAVNQEVRGSKPRRGANSIHLGVAQ